MKIDPMIENLLTSDQHGEPFTPEILPKGVDAIVSETARFYQVSTSMSAAALIGCTAGACVGAFKVAAFPGYIEPSISVWPLVIAAPSERKSPLLRWFLEPLQQLESDYSHVQAAEVAAAEAMARRYDRQIAEAEANAEITDEAALDQIRQLQHEKATTAAAKPFSLCLQDSSVEGLEAHLARHGGIGFIADTEGGLLLSLAGKYGNTVDPSLFNHSFGGEGHKSLRVSRKATIPAPFLAITVFVQPEIFSQFTASSLVANSGLMGRFCVISPESLVGHRVLQVDHPIPEAVRDNWQHIATALFRFCAQYHETGEQHTLVLSEAARAEFAEWNAEFESTLVDTSSPMFLLAADGWPGKRNGLLLRLAGLMKLLRDCKSINGQLVDNVIHDSDLQRALLVLNWLENHFSAAMGSTFTGSAREMVLNAVVSVLKTPIERRAKWRGRTIPGGFIQAELTPKLARKMKGYEIRDELAALVELGALSEQSDGKATVYVLNEALAQQFGTLRAADYIS